MPLYEYECPKDGTFERMQKFSDPPVTACPTCGGPVEKLLSAPAIQFKGTGWYITDYARKTSGAEGGSKGAESAASGSSSDSASAAPAQKASKDTPTTGSSK